jgi:hypothetical protein
VHGSALALDDTGAFAIELGHHRFGICPHQQHMGVIAIGRNHPVAFLEGIDETGRDGFLPGVDMQIPADLALAETAPGGVLEQTDFHHLPVEFQHAFGIEWSFHGIGGVGGIVLRRRRCRSSLTP